MPSPFRNYLSLLRQYPCKVLSSPAGYFVRPHQDFTRHRSLFLERIQWLIVGLLRKTLSIELDRFFEGLFSDELAVTKSALVQARAKLLPRFFRDLFQLSTDAFYKEMPFRRWQGFRLWATDGSGFRLPDVLELGETFGWHGNQHNRVPSSRMLVAFDLLNQVFTKVAFHTRHCAELVMAVKWVGSLPRDVVMVYDRGYASHLLPYLHRHFGSNCIVRMPVGQSKTIESFVKSGQTQQTVTETLQIKARNSLNGMGIAVNASTTITFRLIRFVLPNGTVEVLLTTLLDKKTFRHHHFGRLYHKRWGIETAFFVIKSYLKLCIFSAHTSNRCIQDLFSTFIFYNIQTASIHELQPKLAEVNQRRSLEYQANRNVGAGLLKRFFTRFFLLPEGGIAKALAQYTKLMLQSIEPVRPNKNRVRKRKMMRGTERHVHEKNYRPAI